MLILSNIYAYIFILIIFGLIGIYWIDEKQKLNKKAQKNKKKKKYKTKAEKMKKNLNELYDYIVCIILRFPAR